MGVTTCMARLLDRAHATKLGYATRAIRSEHRRGQISSPDEQISHPGYLFWNLGRIASSLKYSGVCLILRSFLRWQNPGGTE